MATTPTIMLLAGETSGDQHGGDVARELQLRLPGARMIGTGGSEMEAAGVELFAGLDELAVMGFVEVLGRLGYFRHLERRIEALLAKGDIDLVIPIDYPGFNLRIAGIAKRLGVPVLFYIAPQVWAWRAHRAKTLAHVADHIAVILPFEVPIFEAEGGRVTFVGHPLLDHGFDEPSGAGLVQLDPARPTLALLPGSRPQEVARHLAPMLETARLLAREQPDLQVAVAQAKGIEPLDLPEHVVRVEGGRGLLRAATVAVVKSGTSTLEAALAGVPFVCVYRTHPLTFALAKRLVRLDSVALANLVAGEAVAPEFIQDDFTPAAVAARLQDLLDPESPARANMIAGLEGIKGQLGAPGAASRVADIALGLLPNA